MIKLKIGLDWDDVTAPFNSIAIKMANEEMGLNLKLSDITSWENTGKAEAIKKYYHDERLYIRQSKAIPGENKKIIRDLMEIADVYFITAVAPEMMGIRAAQITEAFPELPPDRIILGAAKSLVHFDVILDDNLCNVIDSPATYAVLMRKPWNKNSTGLLSVNSLGEFYTLMKHIIAPRREIMGRPRVYALVGPTGSMKNAIANYMCENYDFEKPTVYTTTHDYGKITVDESCFSSDEFYEFTAYGGHYYGTKKEDIKDILSAGKNVVMPLDMCGVISLRNLDAEDSLNPLAIYIDRPKDKIIMDILRSNLTNEERTLRIMSIDAERKNSNLCDKIVHFKKDYYVEAAKQIVAFDNQ